MEVSNFKLSGNLSTTNSTVNTTTNTTEDVLKNATNEVVGKVAFGLLLHAALTMITLLLMFV